jgi:hypothetical protein
MGIFTYFKWSRDELENNLVSISPFSADGWL